MLTDKQITCVDCGTEFTFTSGEQERFAQLGFTNEPKRCGPCRQAKKASRGGDAGGGGGDDCGDDRDQAGGAPSEILTYDRRGVVARQEERGPRRSIYGVAVERAVRTTN